MAYLVTDACTACGACLLTSPSHAFDVGVPLRVLDDRCTDCGECVEVCPADAIERVPADHGVVRASARSAPSVQLHDRRELCPVGAS
jgi:ferredoxin